VQGHSLLWAALSLMATISDGFAQGTENLPRDYQLGLQDAAGLKMANIIWMHNDILMPIVTVITLFVLLLLIIVVVRFNARSNPNPSRTTHNTTVEVLWTIIPILILIGIAIPSFKLLYEQRTIPEVDMTIKAIGHQWYWSYEYPDHGDLAFDSVMLEDDERSETQPRLLAVDNAVVVPVDTVIRVIVTGDDVIHNWAMPALGIKMDAIPGRLNEVWFKAERTGTFYGMCSELCGVRHAFMPIELRVVSADKFKDWLEKAQQEFSYAPVHRNKKNPRIAAILTATQLN
jgi:cytochrome c oxidase subunit 2